MAEYGRGRGPHFAAIPVDLLTDPEADAYTIATYAAIRSYADFGSDHGARVGDGTACQRAGCSERIFRDRRERLRRMGWLEWEQRPGLANRYVVHSSRPTTAPDAGVDDTDPGTTRRGTPAPHADPPRHQVPTTKSHTPRASTESSVSSSLRSSETGRGPIVEKSKSEGDNGEPPRRRPRRRRGGASAAGAVLGDLAGTAPPADPVHESRTRLMADVQEVAWLGASPPLREGEDAESARAAEAALLGALLRGATESEVRAALAGARSYLGPGVPFRLPLLAARTKNHFPLFGVFTDLYFGRGDVVITGAMTVAIRAALTGEAGAGQPGPRGDR